MGLHPQVTDRYQSLIGEPLVRHAGLRRQGSRQMPIGLAAQGGEDGLAFARTQRQQMANFGTHPPPLFPVTHADAPSQPLVETGHGAVEIRNAEVVHPTSQVFGELVDPVSHRHTPATPRQATDAMFEVVEGLVGPAQFRSSKGKARKTHFVGSTHPTLLLVDDQSQLGGQIPCNAGLKRFRKFEWQRSNIRVELAPLLGAGPGYRSAVHAAR